VTLAKIKVHLVLSSGKDKLCEIIWYMGVIPLPEESHMVSLSTLGLFH